MHVLGQDRWALAASRNGKDCGVWDASDGRLVGMLGLDEAVTIEASRNFEFAILTGRAQTTLWGAPQQKILTTWPTPPGVAGTLPKFSPDHKQLAMHDRANHIYLYAVPSGTLALTLTIPSDFQLWDVSWASAQRLLAVGSDGRLGEWNLAETAAEAARMGLRW
jgi:WD40 repeat protein